MVSCPQNKLVPRILMKAIKAIFYDLQTLLIKAETLAVDLQFSVKGKIKEKRRERWIAKFESYSLEHFDIVRRMMDNKKSEPLCGLDHAQLYKNDSYYRVELKLQNAKMKMLLLKFPYDIEATITKDYKVRLNCLDEYKPTGGQLIMKNKFTSQIVHAKG